MSNNSRTSTMFRCYRYFPFYIINKQSKVNFMVLTTVDILVAIPAILLNLLFLYTIYKHSKFRKTISHCLFVNLAVLGLFIGAVHLPLHAIQMLLLSQALPKCSLFIFNDCSSYMVSTLSFLTLICITLDAYCGVIKPFFYQRYFTRVKVMALLWVVCGVFIVISVLSCFMEMTTVYTIMVCVLVIAGVVFFVFAYTHIYLTVFRMRRRVSCASIQSTRSNFGGSTEKTMRTSIFIVFAFIVTYLPTGVYAIVQAAEMENEVIRTYMFHWVYTIRLSSCLVNAFLYYWRLKDLRAASLKFMPACLQKTVDYRAKKESYLKKVSTVCNDRDDSNLPERFFKNRKQSSTT